MHRPYPLPPESETEPARRARLLSRVEAIFGAAPWRNVTLELSLKPFVDPGEAAVRAVLERLFRQWAPLYRDARQLSLLLWVGDGSEILDYAGKRSDVFEWGCWIGTANPYRHWPDDPEGRCPHSAGSLYIEDPPRFTYGWLQRLVALIKEVGAERTGLPIRVGATFDPGPEFARSSFKYERHREILGPMWHGTFMYCYAALARDMRPYAGYPQGIPEGLSIGRFLGRQARHFAADLGFDYLWLSNGFGFGTETWTARGAVFDGQRFAAEHVAAVRERLLGFWRDFRAECPELPLETRGSNQSTGIDLATDATPLAEIYRGRFGMEVPPNSPWAAINGDFGLELAGWMSHIAELPETAEGFPFRFYTHDPWWLNSPWLDRYERQPHDIHLPLSVCRLNARGEPETPDSVLLLTVDDSRGRMPDAVPDEVIPHLKAARRTAPDAPGPLVWLYPFDEYHKCVFGSAPALEHVFFGDRFIRSAINHGLPLNTVISTTSFIAARRERPDFLRDSVLVSPVPAGGTTWSEALLAHVAAGGRVLLYGPMTNADPRLRAALQIESGMLAEGEFALDLSSVDGALATEWREAPRAFEHDALLSGGGLGETSAAGGVGWRVVASRGTATRVVAAAGKCIAWVRGSETRDASLHDAEHRAAPAPDRFPMAALMRAALARLGCEIAFAPPEAALPTPILTIARHRQAYFFSGFTPCTEVALSFAFPHGAPLLHGADAALRHGRATYRMPRAWRHECRVFVRQDSGRVSARDVHAGVPGVEARLLITGLHDAQVTFHPDPAHAEAVRMLRNPVYPYLHGEFVDYRRVAEAGEVVLVAEGITGPLLISW